MAEESEPAEAQNPVFDVEPKADDGAAASEAEAMLVEIRAAHAALGLRIRELEQAQQGVVEATPVDESDGGAGAPSPESDGSLLVYASNAARHVFAQKVVAPACFHQVTTVVLVDPAKPAAQKALFLVSSFALLLLQTMTLLAVAGGVSAPTCDGNWDCAYGRFCSQQGYCSTCLMNDGVTPRLTGAVLSSDVPGADYLSVDESAKNATAFCAAVGSAVDTIEWRFCRACYDPSVPGDTWNLGQTMGDTLMGATSRMRGGDWATLVLVASVVGLYCAGELRDIKLCQLTFQQRDGRHAPGWVRGVLFVLVALRQYAFLPWLIHIVSMLVMHRGSDAINICFNALAVLFLLDIDAALFQFWIPERLREEMERFGAPTVREIDATFLASVKRSHAVLVAFWVTVSVMVAGTGNPSGQALTNAAFFCGGIYEAVIRARLFEEETIGKALGQWFGSFLVGLIWTGFVFGPMVGMNWVINFGDYQMEACGAGAAAQQPNCAA